MELELLKARQFLFTAAQMYDDPKRRPFIKSELGAAKHIVTNAVLSVVDKAMRITGAKAWSEIIRFSGIIGMPGPAFTIRRWTMRSSAN